MAELEEEVAVLNSGTNTEGPTEEDEEGGQASGGRLTMTTFLSQLEPHDLVARVR